MDDFVIFHFNNFVLFVYYSQYICVFIAWHFNVYFLYLVAKSWCQSSTCDETVLHKFSMRTKSPKAGAKRPFEPDLTNSFIISYTKTANANTSAIVIAAKY